MRTVGWLMGVMFVVSCAVGGGSDGSQTTEELGACQPHCKPCTGHQVCTMLCTYSDHCPTQHGCTEFMACIQGYTWNADACTCLPTKPEGEGCGPSLTC